MIVDSTDTTPQQFPDLISRYRLTHSLRLSWFSYYFHLNGYLPFASSCTWQLIRKVYPLEKNIKKSMED